ncbi:Uncharacterised protein [Salmonella enterica subsp. diarizonae]|uniref:Uncharacterized protein n=1 Tax=Salmonella diarizonae TaxID=59204 RepID=A0A379TT45_SALDZ|nr:Uncharacterised protein [Salmonella enterica subsp. diarizonae]
MRSPVEEGEWSALLALSRCDLEWGDSEGNFNDGQRTDVGIAAISRPLNIIPAYAL